MVTLRPYQSEALTAIEDAYQSGVRRQLLTLPTGGGKTVVFSELVNRRPGRALILAHRDRLIQQAAEKLSSVIPIDRIGIVKAEQNRFQAPVVVASVQTLSRSRRREMLSQFDTVIVDEAHRSAARIYREILDHVCNDSTLLLGVTATPNRTDSIGLDQVYDRIVYQVGLLDLIEQGFLVPLVGRRIAIDADFSSLHTKTNTDGVNDYRQDEVVNLMEASNWYENVGRGWLEFARTRRTLAFVPRVAMAYKLAEWLRDQGVAAAALDGSTPLADQRRIVGQFERGEIQFLANCDLFVEGADIPSIECVVFARPTKSQIVYSQAIGRGTRPSPSTGKRDCLVLDMVGATNRFDLCTLGSIVGVKRIQDGESIVQAVAREKAAAQAKAEQEEMFSRVDGHIVGREANLFGTRFTGAFDWDVIPEQRLAVLRIAGGEFHIWRAPSEDLYHYADMSWSGNLQGQASTYAEAKAACESAAKIQFFGGLDAPWRGKPASDKQIALLTKLRIPFAPHITKGEAAALIDARFAPRKASSRSIGA